MHFQVAPVYKVKHTAVALGKGKDTWSVREVSDRRVRACAELSTAASAEIGALAGRRGCRVLGYPGMCPPHRMFHSHSRLRTAIAAHPFWNSRLSLLGFRPANIINL